MLETHHERPLPDHEGLIAKIANLLRLHDKDADNLASSKSLIEQTDYDGWDGGTDIYTSYL